MDLDNPADLRAAAERLDEDAENYLDETQAKDTAMGAAALRRLADLIERGEG